MLIGHQTILESIWKWPKALQFGWKHLTLQHWNLLQYHKKSMQKSYINWIFSQASTVLTNLLVCSYKYIYCVSFVFGTKERVAIYPPNPTSPRSALFLNFLCVLTLMMTRYTWAVLEITLDHLTLSDQSLKMSSQFCIMIGHDEGNLTSTSWVIFLKVLSKFFAYVNSWK